MPSKPSAPAGVLGARRLAFRAGKHHTSKSKELHWEASVGLQNHFRWFCRPLTLPPRLFPQPIFFDLGLAVTFKMLAHRPVWRFQNRNQLPKRVPDHIRILQSPNGAVREHLE